MEYAEYRVHVLRKLPNLRFLDSAPVTAAETNASLKPINRIPTARRPPPVAAEAEEDGDSTANVSNAPAVTTQRGAFSPGSLRDDLAAPAEEASFGFGGLDESGLE